MKLGLELMAAVGPHRMNPKQELCDHVVEKTYGVRLGVARVNLEGPDTGGIVDGGVRIATYRLATWADEFQERDIDLDVMAGDLLGVAMRVHRSTTDPAGQAVEAVEPQDAVDGRVANRDAVIALEIPDDANRTQVVGPT